MRTMEEERKVEAAEVDLDVILKEVGVFGKYQFIYFLLLLLPVLLTSTHANNYIFSVHSTYRCKIPICDDAENEFEPQWLENAFPGKKRCEMFPMLNESRLPEELCTEEWFDSSRTIPCQEYVFKEEHSFMDEFGIACQEQKRTLVGTMHSIGMLIALPFVGYFSDRYGRKAVMAFSCAFEGIMGIVKSLSVNYGMFIAFELIEPALGSGVYTATYILALEMLIPKYRTLAAVIINISYASGQATMAGINWAVPYWRTFLQIIYGPIIVLFIYYWIVDESPRWLLNKRRYGKVLETVEKAAKINGNSLSDQCTESLRFNAENESKFQNGDSNDEEKQKRNMLYKRAFKSRIIVVRLLKCAVWWISSVFSYYGLAINAVSLSGTFQLNFIFTALVEIPSHFIGLLVLNYVGRKWCLFIAYSVGGATSLAFAFLPKDPDLHWLSMTLYLVSKMFVTLTLSSVYLYTSELFPTPLRHSFVAFCSMIGRIGAIIAPQTPLLTVYYEYLPSILFGFTCMISAILVLTSPETLHTKLPETIEEAENIGSLKIDKQNVKQ